MILYKSQSIITDILSVRPIQYTGLYFNFSSSPAENTSTRYTLNTNNILMSSNASIFLPTAQNPSRTITSKPTWVAVENQERAIRINTSGQQLSIFSGNAGQQFETFLHEKLSEFSIVYLFRPTTNSCRLIKTININADGSPNASATGVSINLYLNNIIFEVFNSGMILSLSTTSNLISINNWNILTLTGVNNIIAANTYLCRINGVDCPFSVNFKDGIYTPKNVASNSSGYIHISRDAVDSFFGDIHTIILDRTIINKKYLEVIEGVLLRKLNMNSILPNNHPYKTATPTLNFYPTTQFEFDYPPYYCSS